MNAKLPVMTITTEQLKHFEFEKETIQSNLESTQILFDQLAALFSAIESLGEQVSGAPSIRIQNLAGLGQFTCETWSSMVTSIQQDLEKISPLNSTEI